MGQARRALLGGLEVHHEGPQALEMPTHFPSGLVGGDNVGALVLLDEGGPLTPLEPVPSSNKSEASTRGFLRPVPRQNPLRWFRRG